MKPLPALLLASACALGTSPALTPLAAAQPLHRSGQRHLPRYYAVHRYVAPRLVAYGRFVAPNYEYGYGGFNAGAAQVPPRGFYDGYYGPGATVLRRGLAAQYEPGATSELEPDAKQTATGGPVGGLPGRSGP